MIWKNILIHNAAEIVETETPGCITTHRIPRSVYDALDTDFGRGQARNSTGVELRFVMHSPQVTLRMKAVGQGRFHVFRGSIQGPYTDHETDKNMSKEMHDFVIDASPNLSVLDKMTAASGFPFDPRVVRVIFDIGRFELCDVIGDVTPPTPEMMPEKTILFYGSSITHTSNSIDRSSGWPSVTSHNLGCDHRNLGFAGTCRMEPAMIDYIASEGEAGHWQAAVLELGINVLGWDDATILDRAANAITQVASRNADKPIFVISPFYCSDDFAGGTKAAHWREMLEMIIKRENLPNVTYINGLDLLGDISLLSGDVVHPSIFGAMQIGRRLSERLKGKI